jgi:glycosyltransferase involved in cell wall biosynthesis
MSRTPQISGPVVYVGPFSFPTGGAATRRILGNCLSIQAAGYRVIVGTGQLAQAGAPVDEQEIGVVSLNERTAENLPILLKHSAYLAMGRKTLQWLEHLTPRPHAVILYSGYSPYFMRLIPWCRKNGVPLAFDAVEWYGPSRTPGGRFGPYRLSFELAMRHYVPRCGNVIAISHYLEEYYLKQGCRTIRVPPTLDTSRVDCLLEPADCSHGLRLGYTGDPGNKDLLDPVIEAVLRTNVAGVRVEFHVAGMTPEALLDFPAFRSRSLRALPAGFVALGKVPQAKAVKLVAECHFTVLLRPPTLDSTAGFPTKVVESLSVGTPVICNLTSDLAEHVFHGRTGLVCSQPTAEACKDMIELALSLTRAQLAAMRLQVREHASMHFDYRRHVPAFDTFLQQLKIM